MSEQKHREWFVARIDQDTNCYIYDNENDAKNRLLSGIKLPPHWLGRNPYYLKLIEHSALTELQAKLDEVVEALKIVPDLVKGLSISNNAMGKLEAHVKNFTGKDMFHKRASCECHLCRTKIGVK